MANQDNQDNKNNQSSQKQRILEKLGILAKYQKLGAVLAHESESMEEFRKGFQDQDEIAAIKQKLNI
ncbi:hypothetical protein KKD70_02885 [Patescibacteria group bacterium]|nr:hypothetical protein [Patescibacteria group bacterium]